MRASPPSTRSSQAAGSLLVLAGRTIMGTVGGASGALYGRALVRAAAALDAWPVDAGPPAVRAAAALRAAVDGIAALGRSRPGEKTMLDALVPAVEALEAAATAGIDLPGALREAANAAAAGARATWPLLATKGRASLPRRAVGRPSRPGRGLERDPAHGPRRRRWARRLTRPRDPGRLAIGRVGEGCPQRSCNLDVSLTFSAMPRAYRFGNSARGHCGVGMIGRLATRAGVATIGSGGIERVSQPALVSTQ